MKKRIIETLQDHESLTLGEIAFAIKRDRDIIAIELDDMVKDRDLDINDSIYSLHKIEIMPTRNNNLDNLSSLLFDQLNKLTAVNTNIDINQCKAVSNLARDVISIERIKLDEKQINIDIANHLIEHGHQSSLPKLLSHGS